jgi:two-component system sensor histidine kinase PhoQ
VFNSIFGRLILATLIVLSAFFSFLDYGANRIFSDNVFAGKASQLKLQSYLLLSSAGIGDGVIFYPDPIPEKRFYKENSGLYGIVTSQSGKLLWVSDSAKSLKLPIDLLTPNTLASGTSAIRQTDNHLIYQQAVTWELNTQDELITFSVIEDSAPAQQEIAGYRQQLRRWFIAPAIALVIVMLLTLRFGIKPLQRLASSLKRIEEGHDSNLDEDYPIELKPIAKNLNELLFAEKQQRERYQKTLANLAHSLKTPLAVIQADLESGKSDQDHETISEQVSRIDEIVQHQLQRAVISAPHSLTEPVSLLSCIEDLVKALAKVYIDKNIHFRHTIDDEIKFKGDKRDLMEMLGNILDNACKACVNTVQVKSYGTEDFLIIDIEDDGKGIPQSMRDKVLLRGTRTDSTHPGQGLGLDTVAEIVDSYQGQIQIDQSPMGGAKFRISLPRT